MYMFGHKYEGYKSELLRGDGGIDASCKVPAPAVVSQQGHSVVAKQENVNSWKSPGS
jgi:hypothetical protein